MSGSIGALAQGKWTFEKAYKIAQAFQSVKEMCEEYEYLYRISKARPKPPYHRDGTSGCST